LKRQIHRAQANQKLCQHEVERLRARHQLDQAEIKCLKRYVRDLEMKLVRLRAIEQQIDELRRKHFKRGRR
jgi:alpha-ketoglutarate-dependent taurine dioxygenase